ncbi:type II secretion system protein [Pirellula staleyi DSM 6068]|uniref:Type II secretion system protein n=1 Tax=Pirellula staleyi (strain ATCC 27377 / DSM 6068 / ICPB 4128) TaxID=530564 RepID=D2R1U5_PIRSD|nr:type II secretion system F family protein [Pirellula staleyi]ADB16814.1 type II secretion system protein [Pirellula staleyi DSM 6068]
MGPVAFLLLLPLAVALKMASRLLEPLDQRSRASTYYLLDQVSHLLFIFVLFALIWVLTGWLSLLVNLLLIVVLLMYVDRFRRAEHEALLWSLAISAERGVNIIEAAEAYASESTSDVAIRSSAIATSLRGGQSLENAVRYARLRLSTCMKLAVSFGGRLGRVSPLLELQKSEAMAVANQLRGQVLNVIMLLFQLFVLCFVVCFTILKIMPVMRKILSEFGLKEPDAFQFVYRLLEQDWFFPLGGIIVTVVAIAGPILMALLIFIYVGWISRGLPGISWMTRRYDAALVLAGIRHGVLAGLPLDETLLRLAQVYPLWSIRHRLELARRRIAGGANWTTALQNVGLLPQADAALLDSAERAGNLPWALKAVSEGLLRRLLRWAERLNQFLWPCLIFMLGGVVFFMGYVVFVVLSELVRYLA